MDYGTTFFGAIFEMASKVGKMINSNLRTEIEKVYFRFTKSIEKNRQIDVNELLGQKDAFCDAFFKQIVTIAKLEYLLQYVKIFSIT